ncbi:hypothetical protein KEM55_005622 [Ascosphaera atra]|nr:hypothetical protein KEM55_005622 [Ascosphaera atra]
MEGEKRRDDCIGSSSKGKSQSKDPSQPVSCLAMLWTTFLNISRRRRAQIFRLLGAISIAILLMAWVWQFDEDDSLRRPPPGTHEDPVAASLSKLGQQRQQFVNTNFGERVYNARPHGRFWRELHSLLDASKPTLRYPIKTLLSEGGDSKLQYRPKEEQQSPLPQNLEIEDDDLETLRLQHEKFLRLLDEDAPRLAYRPRTNGIVMTANKEMVPSLLTTLHMLRLTGTQLPVEVFLGDDRDYDEFVCEETLPLLNAKCIRMSQVFKKSPLETKLIGFQFKIFSILFSSFQNVMFLDVDNIPLRSLDKLPSSKAFKQKGLLIWPAYYKSTASPAFFDLPMLIRALAYSRAQQPQPPLCTL